MAVKAVTQQVGPEKKTSKKKQPQGGLYTVRTRRHHSGEYETDLTFMDAMRHIQNKFEESKGEVHFASIELQP